MDIRHLRYFVGIAESGSLMRASERLHVAQPALSVHISNLEVELRVKLMERSNRGIKLTAEGQLLYDRAKTLLGYFNDTIQVVRKQRETPGGEVSVGLPSTTVATLSPSLYRRVSEELPEVSLYVTDASTAMVYELMQEQRLDLAILFNAPDSVELDLTPAGFNEYYVYGVPGMLPGGGTDMDFDELFQYPLVLPSQASTWRKILDDIAVRRGKRLTTTMESESYNVLRAITLEGMACCVLGGCALQDEVAAGKLVARRLVNPSARGVLTVARLQSAVASPAVDAVKAILIDEARKAYSWHESSGEEAQVLPMLRALPTQVLPQDRLVAASR